jgi:NAD(P)-dependent dehydrogenase (short-subunit alcohol dehydrogenase family)
VHGGSGDKRLCEGRVVAITGAGGGLGRAHALACGEAGARVVVNDLGGARDGSGADRSAAAQVVAELRERDCEAVANFDDISTWAGAEGLVRTAVETFGGLDALVNNAGVLRDRLLVNMTEEEWDVVLRVHLRGTFSCSRHAAAYWRAESKAGRRRDARLLNTSSASGLFGNTGQTNYGAAKAAIASFSLIAAEELARYGVTVNAISPTALTRMTADLPAVEAAAAEQPLAPEDVSPLVAWLVSERSRAVSGRVFAVRGNRVTVLEGWVAGPSAERPQRWRAEEFDEVIPALVEGAAPNADMSGDRSSPPVAVAE